MTYENNRVKKETSLHKTHDADILKWLEENNIVFSVLVKHLIRKEIKK